MRLQDIPQGFAAINLQRKKCFSVRGSMGSAQTADMRSALHYLRNYALETAGFLIVPAKDGSRNKIALLEAAHHPHRDQTRYRRITTLSDRLMKLTFLRFKHLVLYEGDDEDEAE